MSEANGRVCPSLSRPAQQSPTGCCGLRWVGGELTAKKGDRPVSLPFSSLAWHSPRF